MEIKNRPPEHFGHNIALFLDLDGTLVEISERPSDVKMTPSLLALLQELYSKLNGALAIVSGRTIAGIDALLNPLQLPCSGKHGWERRGSNGKILTEKQTDLRKIRQKLENMPAQNCGIVVEDKGSCIAIHYRNTNLEQKDLRNQILDLLKERPDLECVAGKMVFEIKSKYFNKGSAISHLMCDPPFRGRTPVFLGDDTTDEDGFTYVNRSNGKSIVVGENYKSAANFSLENVEQTKKWLSLFTKTNEYLS